MEDSIYFLELEDGIKKLKIELETNKIVSNLEILKLSLSNKESLEKEIEKLRVELNKLKEERIFLYEEVERFRKSSDTFESELSFYVKEYEKLKEEYSNLKKKSNIEELENYMIENHIKKLEEKVDEKIENNNIVKEKIIVLEEEQFSDDPLKWFDNIFNPVEKLEEIQKVEVTKEINNSDYKIDNFFENLMPSKKVSNMSTGNKILPLEEIMSESELKIYAVKLEITLKYEENLDNLDEKEFFRFLVGYAFNYYEDGEFWEPLFNYIGKIQNPRYQNIITEKIKKAADMYDYVFYVNSAGNRAFVETVKMHTIIPINYVKSILSQLHTIYRRDLKGTSDKIIFNKVIRDKFDNKEFHSIKTLHHLWEMKKDEEVISYLYELIQILDNLDRKQKVKTDFLRKDVVSEIEDWYENSLERLYISKGSLAEYFGRNDLKDPSFTLNYRNREVTLKEFSLPDNILKVKLRISYSDHKESIERKVEYYRSNNLYKTKEEIIKLESEDMIFGRYEVVIDTDKEKNIIIYTEEKSYILLNDEYIQIRNLETYSGNNFYVQYLSNYYEIISSEEITTEKVGKNTERALLNKNSINYLRDLHEKKVFKRLSIIESKDINFVFNRLENLKMENFSVFSTHPYPEGLNSVDHVLFINEKKVDAVPEEEESGIYTMADRKSVV